MLTKAKICGITNVADARSAIELGADFLGLIFVSSSPRSVTPDAAKEICELRLVYPTIKIVGVFKDAPLEEIKSAVDLYSFDFVQCHGSETPEFCRAISTSVIKVIEIDGAHCAERGKALLDVISQYRSSVECFLYDRPKYMKDDDTWLEGAVATLQAINCDPGADLIVPYFFAGGLDASSVKSVVARLKPFAVDVASGVEAAPGRKDLNKVRAFLEQCGCRGDTI